MLRSLFRSRVVIGLVAAILLTSLVSFGYAQDPGGLHEFLGAAIAAQKRHTDDLLTIPDVVGTAIGLTADGRPTVKVYTKGPGRLGIPDTLDGVPVEVEETGEFFALSHRPGHGGTGGGSGIDPKSRFPRPVPIGISTGNEGECSAGTIGARVKDASNTVYALSNNHVYALENTAPLNSNVLQPGRFDTNCNINPNDVIGTLFAFEPIVFSPSANNTIDAAIALSDTANLGNATPSNGYGTPKSAIASAFVGQSVQKYGRTTSLTKGRVTGILATVQVGYSSGTARFVNQIVVGSRKPFIKAGDSGSLLVADPDPNPVGLLFAGNSSGNTAIANSIGSVLVRFDVTVDGAP